MEPGTGYPTIAHIAHGAQDQVRFVRWDGLSWDAVTVGDSSKPSLAYDPMTGAACIGYAYKYGQTWFARRVWRQDTYAYIWERETVDMLGSGDTSTSQLCLKFGPDGCPSLSYCYSDYGDLKFARRSEWP